MQSKWLVPECWSEIFSSKLLRCLLNPPIWITKPKDAGQQNVKGALAIQTAESALDNFS